MNSPYGLNSFLSDNQSVTRHESKEVAAKAAGFFFTLSARYYTPDPCINPELNTRNADKTKTPQIQGCSILNIQAGQCNECAKQSAVAALRTSKRRWQLRH